MVDFTSLYHESIPHLRAFFGLFLIDFLFVWWTTAVHRREIWIGAFYSGLIVVIQGFVVLGYVSDPWTLTAAGIGGFFGSAAATWYDPKHQNSTAGLPLIDASEGENGPEELDS